MVVAPPPGRGVSTNLTIFAVHLGPTPNAPFLFFSFSFTVKCGHRGREKIKYRAKTTLAS